MSVLISIVIPVKNGSATLRKCLESIFGQTLIDISEVIIIDSGSTDDSIAIIKKYPVHFFQILPEDFNHGATRNYGVSLAKGEFIVMTVQDAIPADKNWLKKLYENFKDNEVAGVCGQQIVPHHRDKNPHEWFRPQSPANVREVQFTDEKSFQELSPVKKRYYCSWDNVNAMYRRTALQKVPFEEVVFGEDMLWAKDALIIGFKIIYDTSARIEHYHTHSPNYTIRRTLVFWHFAHKTFGFFPLPELGMKGYLIILYRNFKWKAHPKWIVYNWSKYKATAKAIKLYKNYMKSGKLDSPLLPYLDKIPIANQKTAY